MWPFNDTTDGEEKEKVDESTKVKFDRVSRIAKLEDKVRYLEEENRRLKSEKEYIDVDIGDPDKQDHEDRQAYVSKVAGIYDSILGPKFKRMSANVRGMLSNTENDDKTIRMLQGADYALWEIIRWGKKLKSEHVDNQMDN